MKGRKAKSEGKMHQSYTSQYYKHLKKGAQQSHLVRQKMGWFLADFDPELAS